MVVPRFVVPGTYPIAVLDNTRSAIASAYGFGSQMAFHQAAPAAQVEAEMISLRP
jgi:hypothetical protein